MAQTKDFKEKLANIIGEHNRSLKPRIKFYSNGLCYLRTEGNSADWFLGLIYKYINKINRGNYAIIPNAR